VVRVLFALCVSHFVSATNLLASVLLAPPLQCSLRQLLDAEPRQGHRAGTGANGTHVCCRELHHQLAHPPPRPPFNITCHETRDPIQVV
jgi:hypothetical protein